MRVLMVSSLWPPEVLGGAEQYAAALGERLRTTGHVVGVVTLGVAGADVVDQVRSWPYPMIDYEAQPAVRRAMFHVADLARPDTRRRLHRAIETFAPDVVHSHVVQGMGAAALTAPGARGIGHVHTLHDYWLLCQRNSMVKRDGTACVERCTTCRAMSAIRNRQIERHPPDVVIAVSEAVARPHLADLAWMRGRTRIIYNPVEDRPATRATSARPVGAPITFGYFGRLGRDKGILTLLDAFEHAEVGNARLVVAGRGAEEAAVRAAGLGSQVEYRGWVGATEKDALFAELDALVVPSQWQDPAPLVVNEARSRGIAVIGTTAGGIPELVAAASEPLLVGPGDVVGLAGALERFAANPGRFASPAEAVPVDWPGHLMAIEAAYSDAIAGARVTERGRD